MKTLNLIRYIAQRNYSVVVIMDNDDMTPMQAIDYLAELALNNDNTNWMINGSFEKDTLLIYR